MTTGSGRFGQVRERCAAPIGAEHLAVIEASLSQLVEPRSFSADALTRPGPG